MLVALNGYPLAKPVAPLSMTTRNSAVSLAFYERKQGGNASIPSLLAFAHLNFHTAPLASDGHNPIYFVELMQINRCADLAHVRFGSKADMCSAQADVRFVPIADIDGLPVRLRNVLVFDRNYVAFPALSDSCHSALWLVCRLLPRVWKDILVAHADP